MDEQVPAVQRPRRQQIEDHRRHRRWLVGLLVATVLVLAGVTAAVELGGGQRVDAAYVMAQIGETRARGYAFSRGVVTEGVGIIALALPSGRSSSRGLPGERLAVGVGGLIERLDANRDVIVRAIREQIFAAAADRAPVLDAPLVVDRTTQVDPAP